MNILERIEAIPMNWNSESPDGMSLWLLVDAVAGVTVRGSSRLVVQVSGGEVSCGAEQRPAETLELDVRRAGARRTT